MKEKTITMDDLTEGMKMLKEANSHFPCLCEKFKEVSGFCPKHELLWIGKGDIKLIKKIFYKYSWRV